MKKILLLIFLNLIYSPFLSGQKHQIKNEIKNSKKISPDESIRELSKVNRIFNLQNNLNKPVDNKFQDINGEWLCFTTMSVNGKTGNGVMYISLTQKGNDILGKLKQIKTPNSDQFGKIECLQYVAEIQGKFVPATGENPGFNLLILHRKNLFDNFQAFFTGIISVNGDSIIAQLVNTMGHYGTMLMVKQ